MEQEASLSISHSDIHIWKFLAWILMRSLLKCVMSSFETAGDPVADRDSKLANETAKKDGTSNVRYAVGNAVELSSLESDQGFEAIDGECNLVYSHAVSSKDR